MVVGGNRRVPQGRRRRRLVALGAAIALLGVVMPFRASTTLAVGAGNAYNVDKGFDSCTLPSWEQMQTWWNYSPYYWYSVYIGGDDAGCPAGNVTGWLNTVHSQGWNFEYTWFGPQAPCTTYNNVFSYNTATAYNQGWQQAYDAVSQLDADGVANGTNEVPIIYDLDAGANGNSACQAAIDSFIQGWVNFANGSYPYQIPGVYGSICNSNLAALAGLNPPPEFIWGADYDGLSPTSILDDGPGGCGVPNGEWVYQQRLKQYNQDRTETYPNNGVSLYVDDDCANALTTPSGSGSPSCN
jgi:hypothetical protein